jgi:hypothetical protein
MDHTQSAKSVSSHHQLYSKKKTWVIWLATWTHCSYVVSNLMQNFHESFFLQR